MRNASRQEYMDHSGNVNVFDLYCGIVYHEELLKNWGG